MVNSQRKYICSFCAKSFSRSEHRTRHERSHTGYKPFQCKICKHCFVRRDLVQRHIRTVHRVLILANKKDIDERKNFTFVNDGSTSSFNSSTSTAPELRLENNTKSSMRGNNNSKHSKKSSKNIGLESPSETTEESTDDQILDNIVRQMIHVRDLNKESDPESNHTKDRLEARNRNIKIQTSSLKGMFKLHDIYLNPINDYYNSHITNNVINKFHLSYYSDQLIKNFNAGLRFLDHEQLFINTLSLIFKDCQFDNDNFFNKIWVSEDDNYLPLSAVTISCLGNLIKNNVYDQNLWILCWNQSMKKSSKAQPDILTLSLLVFILLKTSVIDKTCLDVFKFYQQSLLYLINLLDNAPDKTHTHIDIKSFDLWNIFDIWVSLTKITDIFNNASATIYKWFLNQNNLFSDFLELTLYDFLNSRNYVIDENLSLPTLNILPDTIYTEANNNLFNASRNIFSIGSFKSTEELHNLIIKINQKFSNLTIRDIIGSPITSTNCLTNGNKAQSNNIEIRDPNYNLAFQEWKKTILLSRSPTKFTNLLIDYAILPRSTNHWLLWESTWFEFLKNLSPTELLYKKVSFLQLQSLQSIYLDNSMINNNLALCAVPLISIIENNTENEELFSINGRFVNFIVDVMCFQLKFFSVDLMTSQVNSPTHIMGLLTIPIIQLLLYVWYSIIYRGINENNVVPDMEYTSVSYFMEKYITNTEQNLDTDKLLEEDINEILFNNKSSAYAGFHYLIQSITSYIKNEIIIKKLFSSASIDQDKRFKLFEFLKSFDMEEIEPNFINSNNNMTSTMHSHRPSISSVGSNSFHLSTSPISYHPAIGRRSSVISVAEDGQKLLLPPLNFVPGQLLSTPGSRRGSAPNRAMETKLSMLESFHPSQPQIPISANVNQVRNYSYDGHDPHNNNNSSETAVKFNAHSLLKAYEDSSRPHVNWFQERRASLPSLSSGKSMAAPVLPLMAPITNNPMNSVPSASRSFLRNNVNASSNHTEHTPDNTSNNENPGNDYSPLTTT